MARTKKRSKKRSDGQFRIQGRHKKLTFFIDRNFGGRRLAEEMRAHGLRVETHDSHFRQKTSDLAWVEVVSERRWIILTGDRAILTDPLEFKAFSAATTATFIVYAFDRILKLEVFDYFQSIYPAICKALDTHKRRGVFTIDRSRRLRRVNIAEQERKIRRRRH